MIRRWWEAWKAWRRGERRIAPATVRGRVYERKAGGAPGAGTIAAVSRWKASIKMRVYRAATGQWEDV